MKKIVLSALALCAFGFANAQSKSDGMVFGVKGGVQFTSLTGDVDDDGATGFYVGGLLDFGIGENFHVQPELLYSVEGSDHASIDYLRLPIMAKYYIMEGLSLQAGPEIAFKVASDDDDFETKSTDWGLGIGGGYEFGNHLMFDARYNLGLTNVIDSDVVDVKTSSFQIGLGYRF